MKARTWTLLFIIVGVLCAAVFYWPWWLPFEEVAKSAARYGCPLCPCIVSIGSPASKFLRRVLVFGSIDAITCMTIGWLVLGVVRLLIRRVSN